MTEPLEDIVKIRFQLSQFSQKFLIGTVALGAGVGIGLLVARKVLKTKYEKLSEQEIAESKAYYMGQASKKKSPEELVADLVLRSEQEAHQVDTTTLEILTKDYRGDQPDRPDVVVNVFDAGIEGWDYELELAKRDENPDDPFIISEEEYMQNEPEHEQISFTYYDGDQVLADERDGVVDNEDITIGKPENLRFGHGSKDKNIVYIRNEGSGTDFEIAYSDKKYAEEVLGFIEHDDDDGRPRKFRLYE